MWREKRPIRRQGGEQICLCLVSVGAPLTPGMVNSTNSLPKPPKNHTVAIVGRSMLRDIVLLTVYCHTCTSSTHAPEAPPFIALVATLHNAQARRVLSSCVRGILATGHALQVLLAAFQLTCLIILDRSSHVPRLPGAGSASAVCIYPLTLDCKPTDVHDFKISLCVLLGVDDLLRVTAWNRHPRQ